MVPDRTRIGDLTRAVTGDGQDTPARRRGMQFRKRGGEEGGGGKNPAVPKRLNLQPQGHDGLGACMSHIRGVSKAGGAGQRVPPERLRHEAAAELGAGRCSGPSTTLADQNICIVFLAFSDVLMKCFEA